MALGVMISVSVCIFIMVGAFACRNRQTMKKELSSQTVFGIVLAAVVVSVIILYKLVMHPPSVAGSGGGGGGGGGGLEGMIRMEAGMTEGMGRQGRPPSPSRDLRRFIQKMGALQQGAPGAYSAEQITVLLPLLTALQEPDRFTDAEATSAMADIQAALTEKQLGDLNALELPRRGRRGPSRPLPQAESSEASAADTGDATKVPPPPEDRRAAFRARMLAVPTVKAVYDQKVAEDPVFAEDADAQRDFFRSQMRELNPFRIGRGKDALDALIGGLKGPDGTPEAPAVK